MVYHHISPDMKQRALQLLKQGWEIEDVAEVLGVSSKSIGRWSDNYDAEGRVDPLSVLRGRPHTLTANAIQELHDVFSRFTPQSQSLPKTWMKMLQTSRKRTRSTSTFCSQRRPSPSYMSAVL
jgi:transposase